MPRKMIVLRDEIHIVEKTIRLGSECKPTDPHYSASNLKEFLADLSEIYKDVGTIEPNEEEVLVRYFSNPNLTLSIPYPEEYGKGRWIALHKEDMIVMATEYITAMNTMFPLPEDQA